MDRETAQLDREIKVAGQSYAPDHLCLVLARGYVTRYAVPECRGAFSREIAYASAWVKCHHPDVFCAALLNSQPMGFYAPAQLVRDARAHGVEVRPVCINASRWDCTLEPGRRPGGLMAVRLGLRMVRGLSNADGARLVAHRGGRTHAFDPYASIEDIRRRAGLPAVALERLAEADAFQGLRLDRRGAAWTVRGLAIDETPLPLFAAAATGGAVPSAEPAVTLAPMASGGEVVEDYRSVGLSLRSHPLAFRRAELRARGMVACAELAAARDGRRLTLAGLVLVRQRPGSANGVTFVTVEDETGFANLVVWLPVFERYRRVALSAGLLACRGRLQREGEVIHLVADRLEDLSDLLRGIEGRDLAGEVPSLASQPGSEFKVPARDFR
jgi:error-prone DNA polymerase